MKKTIVFLATISLSVLVACSANQGQNASYNNNVYYLMNSGEELNLDNPEIPKSIFYFDVLKEEPRTDTKEYGYNSIMNYASALTFKKNKLTLYYFSHSSSRYELKKEEKEAYLFGDSISIIYKSTTDTDYSNFGYWKSININSNMIIVEISYGTGTYNGKSYTNVFVTKSYAQNNNFTVKDF